jgi:molybdopterin/thiamine biosynthesis adenylyltransferase
MFLRIRENLWIPFREAMNRRADVETAGVLLARPLVDAGADVAIVESATVVPDEAYAIRRADQLQLDAVALNRLIRPARDKGLLVFTVHTHGPSVPGFSWADDRGDARLMFSLHTQIPAQAHGSIVLVPDGSVAARAFSPTGQVSPVSVRVVGRTIGMPSVGDGAHDPFFDRQEMALGVLGQERLRRARVGVVGLGGTGSVTAAQLLHLGVGALVLMDGDLVETSNVSRILGSRREDVGVLAKVDVAARYAAALGMPSTIERRRCMLKSEADLALLRGCDVVMSCVDRHLPRALLNRLAYDAAIPVIDMGSAFRVREGQLLAGAGRVVVVGPSRPCLSCWGHIDPDEVRIESLPERDREQLEREGYVQGARVPEPSIIPFNVQVAGAAVAQLLAIVAGFSASEAPDRLAFDFVSGTVRRNTLTGSQSCGICGRGPAEGEIGAPA